MRTLLFALPDLQPEAERGREAVNSYCCFGCGSYIIEGQPVVLATRVLSVEYQRLDESKIYHERCYLTAKTGEDDVRACTGCGKCNVCRKKTDEPYRGPLATQGPNDNCKSGCHDYDSATGHQITDQDGTVHVITVRRVEP